MSENKSMLESIYKNAEMGRDSIEDLTARTSDAQFRDALSHQRNEYQSIMDHADKLLSKRGHSPESVGSMAKVGAKMMVDAKTLIDPTVSNMAGMMIDGSTRGIVKVTSELNGYNSLDGDVRDLAERLLQTEQNNIDQMRQFL